MNWYYRDYPPALLIALKRSRVHLVGYALTTAVLLAVGLPFEDDVVPDSRFVGVPLGVVAAAAIIVLLTWGLVLAGSVAGHFCSALDELQNIRDK